VCRRNILCVDLTMKRTWNFASPTAGGQLCRKQTRDSITGIKDQGATCSYSFLWLKGTVKTAWSSQWYMLMDLKAENFTALLE
jgi:hypothetical protein